jgi:hypothetical protein
LISFRIRAGGGLLWMRKWTFGLHKMGGIWLAEELLASQQELCCMEGILWGRKLLCDIWWALYCKFAKIVNFNSFVAVAVEIFALLRYFTA